MRYTFVLLFLSQLAIAQEEVEFKVSKKTKVQLVGVPDTLLGNTTYCFSVIGISTKELMPGWFAGGELWLNDTGVCIHTIKNTSPAKQYTLKLLSKANTTKELLNKDFTIVQRAQPSDYPLFNISRLSRRQDISFAGDYAARAGTTTTTDSLLLRIEAILSALQPTSFSKSRIAASFNLLIECDGRTDNLIADNMNLSGEMRERLRIVNQGCIVTLKNVKFHSFSDPPEDITLGPYIFNVRK